MSEELADDDNAIVIDVGSGIIKAGFSDQKTLRAPIPTVLSNVNGKMKIGYDPLWNDSISSLSYPIEHGVVKNWNDIETIFSHMYHDELKVKSEEHKVLLTEPIMNPSENKEKLVELMFENFNVPALQVCCQGLLSLVASGRTTGVVLDSGDGVTQVTPIYEGRIQSKAIARINLAGRQLTQNLLIMLNERGYKINSVHAIESARCIKEKLCSVAIDYDALIKDANKASIEKSFELPDGTVIKLDVERFKCSEILFKPSLAGFEFIPGVHDLLFNSLMNCDCEIQKMLFSNIILNGSSTFFSGFKERIENELINRKNDIKVKVISPPERNKSVWIGGSILASLSSFKNYWLFKKEYEEYGSNLIYKNSKNFCLQDLINNC